MINRKNTLNVNRMGANNEDNATIESRIALKRISS